MAGFNVTVTTSGGRWLLTRRLTLEYNDNAEVGHDLADIDVEMAVGNGVDGNDIFLANFLQEIGDRFVETILAHLLAFAVPDSFDANHLVGVLGGDFECGLWFLD